MKKIVTLLLFMVCFCGLVGCGVKPVSDAKINYGSSSIYSEEDMNAAIELIKEEFSTWEGCELHDIFYSSDDEVNDAPNEAKQTSISCGAPRNNCACA